MADKENYLHEEHEAVSSMKEANADAVASSGAHAVGNALLVTQDGVVRKLPIPSSDPNDPLNYKKWQKLTIIISCCWFSIMSLALQGGLGAILNVFFGIYGAEGYTANDVVRLLTFPALFTGIGNFIILPLGLAFGRRPAFLASILVLFAVTIGSAVQNSYRAHLATRILQGLATGAAESLLPLMLTDITFLHERSLVFGFYWATQNMFSSLLNLASSYEAAISWRWYYWVYVIAIGVGGVIAFFGAFETRFSRPATSFDGQIIFTDEFGVTRVFSDSEAQAHIADAERTRTTASSYGQKRTYRQSLAVWSGSSPRPGRVILKSWLYMAESLTSPGILFSVLLASIVLGAAVGTSLTYNVVLQNIYGWPAKSVGLINLGGVIGSLFGMAYAGWPADKFTVWMARRNGGIHMPEHRLIVLIFPGLVGFGSLLLYGFTADGSATWWGPYMGWTLFQFVFVAVLITTTTFAAEAWPQNPGPAIVVVVGAKNIISFGATYGLIPMVTEHGYAWAEGILAGILGGIFLLGIPVYFFNPKWRAYVARKEANKALARQANLNQI